MALTKLLDVKLNDDLAEAVRRSTAVVIGEIAALPATELKVIGPVQLPDTVGVQIPHGLGRKPRAFFTSPVQGAATAGVIQDYASSTPSGTVNDQTKFLSLRATGFGATITVMVMVL